MKKLTLFLAILFVSVLCSACINNIAIQELNNKAQELMQKGDIQGAISRLESSVDLDGTIFETRYNLGVAYISAQEFKKAQTQLEEAIEQNRIELNKSLPAFSQISKVKLYPEEFEKTAKKSIKRFLYQNIDG